MTVEEARSYFNQVAELATLARASIDNLVVASDRNADSAQRLQLRVAELEQEIADMRTATDSATVAEAGPT